MSYKLFDVPVYSGTLSQLISDFSKPGLVLSYNPEIALALPRHPKLAEIFKNNAWNLIDGVGIAWALKRKYHQKFERISGIDLVIKLFEQGGRFFILGSKPEILDRALLRIKQNYSKVEVIGAHSGFFTREQESELVEKIQSAKPEYLLVGMGFPRQEQFLINHPELFKARVAIVMGGSLDVLSGSKKRAPQLFQKFNLEWLFRLLQEPNRLWRQRVLLLFVLRVISRIDR